MKQITAEDVRLLQSTTGEEMMKEIRISMIEIDQYCGAKNVVLYLARDKGFPCNDSVLNPKPKNGLTYFEFHDYKTGELVVRWEEPL